MYVDGETGRPLDAVMAEVAESATSVEALGPADVKDGAVDWWYRIAPCGLVFSVERFSGCTIVWAGTAGEVRHALLHLPFEAPRWVADERASGGWSLHRIDDGGFEHDMEWLLPSEASARCVCATFERHGHKQAYVLRQKGTPPQLKRFSKARRS
jgi:hypothetical protein